RDVSVDDPEGFTRFGILGIVRVGEALAHLEHDVERVRDRKPPAVGAKVLDDALQIRAVDVLHDDEVGRLGDADVEDVHDVGMLEMQRQPRLVQEHRNELLVPAQLGKDALYGDSLLETLERLGNAAKYLGHTALVYALGDRIAVAH